VTNERWWDDLTREMERTPGYWIQALIIDLQLLRRDAWMLLRTMLCRKPSRPGARGSAEVGKDA
jgi:hypothetical protein